MPDTVSEAVRRIAGEGTATPFRAVVRGLRARGKPVTEGILARALRRPDSGVRVLDPWSGPHAPLREFLPEGDGSRGPWIVPEPGNGPDDDPDPDPPSLGRVRRSLRLLGSRVDDRSPGDLARWMALVEEARRLPPAA